MVETVENALPSPGASVASAEAALLGLGLGEQFDGENTSCPMLG